MYLVINNFYNTGPDAMMDDLDRACGWDESSDASDKQQILELKADVDRCNEVIYQLREENAVLRDRLDGRENSGDAYTQYATTAPLIANLQDGLHEAIGALVASGRKIQAIMSYRAATKLGLKECKDYIENNFPPPAATKPAKPCRK